QSFRVELVGHQWRRAFRGDDFVDREAYLTFAACDLQFARVFLERFAFAFDAEAPQAVRNAARVAKALQVCERHAVGRERLAVGREDRELRRERALDGFQMSCLPPVNGTPSACAAASGASAQRRNAVTIATTTLFMSLFSSHCDDEKQGEHQSDRFQ